MGTVREFSTPATSPAPTTGNLTDDVVVNARDAADQVVLSRRSGPGDPWESVTTVQFLAEVSSLAKGLVAAGIGPGDRVAIMSKTRYEWTVLDYAFWFAGAVSVPVYETSSADQVAWVLGDSGARAIVVETGAHRELLSGLRGRLSDLTHVWCLDDGAIADLVGSGVDVPDDDLERRRRQAGPADLATLIYTSGTTGRPRGCALTHGNFMTELAVATEQLRPLFDDEDASTLLFMPMAHVFARIIALGCVRSRTRFGHSSDVTRLTADLADFRPTFVLSVPRVFEKLFNTASQRAAADGRGPLFDRAVETAMAYSRGLERGKIPLTVRARHAAYTRLVYGRVLEALGGACEYAVSGGAPLGERLTHFYRGVGVTVLEGYGLTETTGALTVNLPDAMKAGTVGRPLPGTAVRVADDGELLVRGGQVFSGYWGDSAASAEVLGAGGWLHTGDVGEVDDEGFVRVTGRKKEILVTAGGKNVAPAALEDRIRAHPLVDQCLVVGDGQPYVAALVTIDPDTYPDWAAAHDKSGSVDDVIDDPDLRAEIEVAVAAANRSVSQAEAIRRFRILAGAWTEEGGQLTPSLKLKRSVVLRDARDDIAALYL